METTGRIIYTKISIISILAIVLFFHLNDKRWQDEKAVISSDVKGYYAYLPAIFIHKDLKFKNDTIYYKSGESQVWFFQNEQGTRYIKYTCGLSILYSPFFLVAHLIAHVTDYDADGFSIPYKIALILSSFVFLIIGLYFLSKILLLHFSDHITALTLFVLFLGTNSLNYFSYDMAFPHGYSLAVISIFMYSSIKWITLPQKKWTVLIGLSAGMMTLIRPIDGLFILFLLLYKINSLDELKHRFQLFWLKKYAIVYMLFCFFLVLLPQLIYFKFISGSFLFFSYSGEQFFFGNPNYLKSIFSYRNGWLIYSPLIGLSLLGFLLFKRKKASEFRMLCLIIFPIYTYFVVSWWCWWYVGFGNRAFIHLYPILSLPLALFIDWIIKQRIYGKAILGIVLCLGLFLNFFQHQQYKTGAIHWGAMTKAAYWDSFGYLHPSQNLSLYLNFPQEMVMDGIDAVNVVTIDTLTEFHFSRIELLEKDLEFRNFTCNPNGTSNILCFSEKSEYSPLIKIKIEELESTHINASCYLKDSEEVVIVLTNNEQQLYHSSKQRFGNVSSWTKHNALMQIPPTLLGDSISLYLWNPSGCSFQVKDIEIQFLTISEKVQINN
ncbi:MAG: hypothetical protein M3Q58_09475 [Bacteroidota bacterium]|nr:hypothetical protein [Bacteroidota bacterium]